MENPMIKSLGLSAALLFIVLLMCAGSVSARTGGAFVPNLGSAAQIKAVASAVNSSQVLAIWAIPIYTDGRDDNQDGRGDGNKQGGDDGPRGPKPTPEPST